MNIDIGEVHSEISVGGSGSAGGGAGGKPTVQADEFQVEALRAVVRELIAEEFERRERRMVRD